MYINRGFLSRMFCLSLGFVKVLLLGCAWSSGGRWLRVPLSLPGPCRVMGTALWLSCASAGPSLAQTEPLSLSFLPAISGWQSQGRTGQGWLFVPRAGCLSPRLGASTAVLAASPVPQRAGRAGESHQSQDRPVGSATHTRVCSHLPAHLLTPPSPPSPRVPEQSTSAPAAFLGFEGSLDQAAGRGMNPPGAHPAAPIAAGSQGRWMRLGWAEVCVTMPSSPGWHTTVLPKAWQGWQQVAAGPGRALSPRGSICTDPLDNSRTDL